MTVSRRKFVQTAATSLAAASLLSTTGVAASKSKKIKVATIGCGGRSNRDIPNFIKACKMLGLEADFVALADAFEDKAFEQADKYGVDRSRCIVGWDAYQKVAESDADFVMLITPPVFRPQHLEMLVEAGKHVLMQKPVAVDAPGCRKVIEAGERAKKKGLAILAGTQRRHTVGYMENAAKIENGAIGEILGGTVSWNGTVPWIWERQKSWSDADYLARNWLNWHQMSGDHLGEQHVHNIDVANWYLGRTPESAIGFGGRARRESGNNYDFFSLDLDYGDGVHIHSQCRQISGTYPRVGEFFRGSKGEVQGGGKLKGVDVSIPKFDVMDKDGNLQGLINWIKSARSGNPMNEARQIAESTAAAIMGRYAAYTGKYVRFSDLMENPKSEFYDLKVSVQPEHFEKGVVVLPPENVVPVPGDGGDIRRRV
ncbi:MAG: Gfo/Idh/MocA family oxidoreductase [Opitutales bacterium]|jgi:myo-inositol 2-dehydrogenase / D-chiro-inositol 1-dehydrogenase|nr:Gfo/Idh/MocA family oxidoreductase [Opitutales bacterium]MBT5167833.1 Gfo/Idh/MocA family oxidoreductase [Opitutales bacterium]MBT6380136.1 Gfo/Idh/MocA family oxidoreductase [Opitutales bacterium]